MSNSTPTFDPITQGQASQDVTANAMFDALSPASFFGRRASTTTGLTLGYYGGTMRIDGVLTQIANGTLVLSASATNYVEITRAGVISKNVWAFTPGSIPLYTVVTGTAAITSWTDYRAWIEPSHITSKLSVAITTENVTLTAAQAVCRNITTTGALTATRSLIVPADWQGSVFCNNTGDFQLTVKTAGGAGVVVAQGATALLHSDGTNVVRQASDTREGRLVKAMANANVTLSVAEALNQIIEVTSTHTALRNLVLPVIEPRQWTVFSNTTGGFGTQFIGATGTGITVADGKRAIIYADGTNIVRVTADT